MRHDLTNFSHGNLMLILRTALIVVALGLSGAAMAQRKGVEVELPAGDTKRELKFEGAQPMILGIKLGDTKERVAEILEKEFGASAIKISHERMGTIVDGVVEVGSTKFLSGYFAHKLENNQSNTIDVTLSSPMTGSRVIGIKRKVEFGGNNLTELPDFKALESSVLNNYGPSTKTFFHLDGLQWQYVASNGKLAIRKDKCFNVTLNACTLHGVGTTYLDEMERVNKKGVEVIVSALVVGYGQNTGKARMLNVELKDVGGALESHIAVFDLLTEKGKAALKENAGAAPKIAF